MSFLRTSTIACGFLIAGLALSAPDLSGAQDSDNCRILLCQPQGFPTSHCAGAKRLYKKRLKKGRRPIPPLSECVVDAQSAPIEAAAPTSPPESVDPAVGRGALP